MKKTISMLLMLCTLFCLTIAACGDADGAIVLRPWNAEEGYQYIEYGYYPYFSDGSYAPVVWRVLDVNQNVALLQSAYALDVYDGNAKTTPDMVYAGFKAGIRMMTKSERMVTMGDSMMSVNDLRSERLGFTDKKGNSRTRSVMPTPYVASKDVPMENGYVSYWTYDGDDMMKVTPAGSILPIGSSELLAVVPTLSIGVDKLSMDKGSGTLDDPYASSKNEVLLWMEQNMRFEVENRETVKIRTAGQPIETYSGPGTAYYREGTSRINSRSATITILGKEGRWFMIEYKTGTDNDRKRNKVAWVHENDFVKYIYRYYPIANEKMELDHYVDEAKPLSEFQLGGVIAEEVDLHDDLDRVRKPLYTLWAGQEILFLGFTEIGNQSIAYIETEIYEKPVRGFVPLDSIELDDYEIEKLTNLNR